MHTPSCIAYYVQYADVMYTLGGTHASGHRAEAVATDYRTAQSYYAAAVHMSKGSNLRALYGLCAATSQLAGLKVKTCAMYVQGSGHQACLSDPVPMQQQKFMVQQCNSCSSVDHRVHIAKHVARTWCLSFAVHLAVIVHDFAIH